MVDVIKPILYGSTFFPIKSDNSRSKTINNQITLPIFISNTQQSFSNDRINNNQTKRWIGNYLPNSNTRLIDVAQAPYSLHRKIMYQELSRRCPLTIDSSKGAKNKPRTISKERIKTSTATTTMNFNGGNNVTSQVSFSNGDFQSSRLFDTLSKHFMIKAEPLRPSNAVNNTTTNTLTSWQKYWTSTHAQRRRKEVTEPEPGPVLYRPKREQSMPNETQFVVLRDSPHPSSRSHQIEPEVPIQTDTNTPTKISSTVVTIDKDETDSKRATPQIPTIDINTSSLFNPSSMDMNYSTIISKTSEIISIKPTENDEEKYLTEKSLLLLSSSSARFRSDSEIIEDVSQAQLEPEPIVNKAYRLVLNQDKPKKKKRSPSRRRTRPRSKSHEKRQVQTPSTSKRKRRTSTNKKSTSSSDLSSILITSKSKYSNQQWDKPYVGLRFDPPTPPCSPSLFVWLEDSDPEDNNTPRDKSQIFEQNLSEKIPKI